MSGTAALDFPLCADRRRDEMIRPVVERAVAFLTDQVGATHLEAVILTGSLARGEGSVLLRRESVRLLGDVEFLVIVRAPFDWRALRRHMAALSCRATTTIGSGGQVASVEYGPAGLVYLRRKIRPSIFAYDLLCHGKVVWGRADILGEIRPFGVEAIPREDAVDLIMNRMVEQLMLDEAAQVDGLDREVHAYHLAKTTLDLAGSALAFAGRYVSPYAERQKPFGALLASSPDLCTALPAPKEFQEELELATQCKLTPTVELLFRGDLPQRAATVLAWAKGLWLWEMRRLLGRPSGHFPELLKGYVGREPLQQRLKGWAKFYLHPLRPQGTLSALKAAPFLLKASPQTLTYAAALLAFWALTGEGGPDWQVRAASLLPVRRGAGSNGVTGGEVGDLWRWLIRNN